MERELIIGRNYWNSEVRMTEKYKNFAPIPNDQIGQQSEKIWDVRVSKIHLLLTKSENLQFPYRLKSLNPSNVVYVNGKAISEILIKGDEKVELGADRDNNHYCLNLSQAINDLNRSDSVTKDIQYTQLPIQAKSDFQQTNKEKDPQSKIIKISINEAFKISNVLLVIFLILSIISKPYPMAHHSFLFFLVITLLGNIYLFSKKQ